MPVPPGGTTTSAGCPPNTSCALKVWGERIASLKDMMSVTEPPDPTVVLSGWMTIVVGRSLKKLLYMKKLFENVCRTATT